ncbi:MAG: alpha/beta hydrolase [Lysobacter sp.]|nr:alpha/beta hydrolase [Lysobacter sp.]
MNRVNAFPLIAVLGLGLVSTASNAAPVDFEGIQVEVVGEGRPLLMVPGLNSAGETWRDTCAALQADRIQCHIVTLPGFAGVPAVDIEGPWLDAMRDRLLGYLDHAGLTRPAVIGHSLGGLLALQMSLAQPERFERLIIVDSLPFFPAASNPAATVEMIKPMAEGMRAGMLAADDASYQSNARRAIGNMSNQPKRTETLAAWGAASDRATSAQAMFELMITDVRAEIAAIRTPTLVLGAWAGYAAFGATRESVGATFTGQYQALDGVRIELSDSGYHFLMWDDPQWLLGHVRGFLDAAPVAAN